MIGILIFCGLPCAPVDQRLGVAAPRRQSRYTRSFLYPSSLPNLQQPHLNINASWAIQSEAPLFTHRLLTRRHSLTSSRWSRPMRSAVIDTSGPQIKPPIPGLRLLRSGGSGRRRSSTRGWLVFLVQLCVVWVVEQVFLHPATCATQDPGKDMRIGIVSTLSGSTYSCTSLRDAPIPDNTLDTACKLDGDFASST
jgi:hypothetical protein